MDKIISSLGLLYLNCHLNNRDEKHLQRHRKGNIYQKQNPFYCHVNFEFYYQMIMLLFKFQSVVQGTGSISTPGNWAEKQILRPHLRPAESEILGGCLHTVFTSSPGGSGCPLKSEKHASILTSQSSVLNSTSLDSQHCPTSVAWTTAFTAVWHTSDTQLSWMTQGHVVSCIYLLLCLAMFGIWHINIISVSPPLKLIPILLSFTYFWWKAYHPCSFKFSKTIG